MLLLLLLLLIMMRMLLGWLLLLMVLDFSSRRDGICDDDTPALRCSLMRCVTVDDGSGG